MCKVLLLRRNIGGVTAVASLCASPSQSQEVDTALLSPERTELRWRHVISIDIAPCAGVCHAAEEPTSGNGGPPSDVLAPLSFIMPVKKKSSFEGCDSACSGSARLQVYARGPAGKPG